eukprot:TRINITY_DN42793_c0_g1_i2.p1 TRINITY_DN42793_c0_g1~~TRINITY_DN42793_c0_g1_i2.p1  ORF type:complete len:126 (-),score=32.40 TRINITY_DN42793_c0_g1_i2:11-388(-)
MVMDVAPDSTEDVLKNQSVRRWDTRKRNYVRETVKPEGIKALTSALKNARNEAGTLIKNTKQKKSGTLYEQWKKKQHREIPTFDDGVSAQMLDVTPTMGDSSNANEIGRAVQQECRDRSRMPSSA